jgi:hypothetical protein
MLGLLADSPEVTGTAPIAISTSKSQSNSTGGSNVAEIVGGVAGGIIGTALIAGIVIRFIIRRRRARSAPSDEFRIDGQSDMGQAAAPHPLTIETPRIYVSSFLFSWPRTGVREHN